MNKILPYGNNIWIQPQSKEKIIGDTSKYFMFGEVLGIGEKVKNIQIGDTIAWTLWGMNKVVEANGIEHFFVQDNPDFILAIIKNVP